MASETLLPVGVESNGGWTGDHTDVDEGVDTHDGDATKLSNPTGPVSIRFQMANPSIAGPFCGSGNQSASLFSQRAKVQSRRAALPASFR